MWILSPATGLFRRNAQVKNLHGKTQTSSGSETCPSCKKIQLKVLLPRPRLQSARPTTEEIRTDRGIITQYFCTQCSYTKNQPTCSVCGSVCGWTFNSQCSNCKGEGSISSTTNCSHTGYSGSAHYWCGAHNKGSSSSTHQ